MPSAATATVRKVIHQENAQPLEQCRVDLPAHVVGAYEAQALKQGKHPETLMAERLVKCEKHSDAGLWFNAAEKKRLEACVGHPCAQADGILQRLEPLSRLTVEGIELRIDPVVLKRLSTRTMRGQTLEQLIRQQVDRALKQYVGLLPY